MRLLADENLNAAIMRSLRSDPRFDVVDAVEASLVATSDDVILEWAIADGRILLTHDRATIPALAYQRIQDGLPSPGVLIVSDRMGPGSAARAIAKVLGELGMSGIAQQVVFVS